MITPHSGEELFSFRNLWRAYRECRRNKRGTLNALRFELNLEANLLQLAAELRSHTYRPGRSICFVTSGPKPREVFAADFRDRIVHHLLVGQVEPLFERRFIHDSFACRKGKGTLAASDRLTQYLRQITRNGKRRAYALKLDVASFFPSIDKQRLAAILERAVRNPELRWLTRTILFHDPTLNYAFRPDAPGRLNRQQPRRRAAGEAAAKRGPTSERYPVPAQKSLFGKQNRRGLPIGNLTSQFWANVYLNELDQFVKRRLRARHYVRYVDDLVLLSDDPAELERWRAAIEEFLGATLGLELRADRAIPRLVSTGVEFVGWRTWWSHRLPRRRAWSAVRERVRRCERACVQRAGDRILVDLARPDPTEARPRPSSAAARLAESLASYAGHLRHGACFSEWDALFRSRPWLDTVFARRGYQVRERVPIARIAQAQRFREGYWRAIRHAGDSLLVFFQVGCFIELRGPQRLLAERVLGLRCGRVRRGGYAYVCGFPVRAVAAYRERALAAGCAVAEVPSHAQSEAHLWRRELRSLDSDPK